MKVPSLDVVGQTPGPQTRSAQPFQVRPTDVGQDIQRMGAQLAQGAAAIGQVVGQVQQEADEIRTAEELTALERHQTRGFYGDPETKTEGFLARKGKAAHDGVAPLMEELEKERQRRADSLSNARQRNAFNRRSHALMADAERRAFAHASTEFQRAKHEAIEAAKTETLAAIQSAPAGPLEEESLQRRVLEVTETIGRLNTGAEERELKHWEAEVQAARIAGALQRHDVAGAKAHLEANREKLEPLGPEKLKAIHHQVEVKSMQVMAESTVGDVLGTVAKQHPDGFVSEGAAEALIEKRMTEVPIEYRGRMRTLFKSQLAMAAKMEHEKRTEAKKEAFRVAKAGGMHALHGMADLEGFLQRNEPEYLASLQRAEDAKNRRALAAAKGGSGKASAEKEQKHDNRMALKWLKTLDAEERANADVDALMGSKEWAELGIDHVNDEGRLELEAAIKTAKGQVSKGLARAEKEWTSMAEATWKHRFAGKKAKYGPEEKVLMRAAAQDWFEEYTKKHDGPPTREEQLEQAGKMAAHIPEILEEAKGMAAARARRNAAQPRPSSAPADQPKQPEKKPDTIQVRLKATGKVVEKPANMAEAYRKDSRFEVLP